MVPRRRLRAATASAVAAFVVSAIAGCTVEFGKPKPSTTTASPDAGLSVLSLGPVTTWDPQRLSSPQDVTFASRIFLRTLTTYPALDAVEGQRVPVGDLAADTGRPDPTRRVWSFTLREGLRWQDGTPLTCEDVRYGVSRSFAAPFAKEGLGYPLAYLDIPRTTTGASTYQGPWAKRGQAGFDKAVSCKGPTITFRLAAPTPDFDHVVAQPAFAPVQRSHDQGADGRYAVWSSGPYVLQGAWTASAGGTFVRNPHWDKKSDPVRKAQPDRITYREGVEAQSAAEKVMNGVPESRRAVLLDPVPPAIQQHVLSDDRLTERAVNPHGHLVDYLAPSFASPVMKNEHVRRALGLATSRARYVAALGGESAATPAVSLIGRGLSAHREPDPAVRLDGDPDAAKAALLRGKVKVPVPISVMFRSSPTMDKAMAALSSSWEDGGFEVTLMPVSTDYYPTISRPDAATKADVFWANWAPSWPSAGTVIGPLFDSRTNLSAAGSGRDYGRFHDPKVDAEVTRISAIPDPDHRELAWRALDESLARRGAYIALAQQRSFFLAGAEVSRLQANEALGGFVDLAGIEVEK